MSSNIESRQLYAKVYLWFIAFVEFVGMACVGIMGFVIMLSDDTDVLAGTIVMLCCVLPFFMISLAITIYNIIIIHRPTQFVYFLTLINFVLGFMGLITIIPSVILFVLWLDEEVKNYYLKSK